MKLFTVGFVFDEKLERVLLVHKQKPAWQVGYLNGVGGKIEPGETAIDCMVRECEEETSLQIPADQWNEYATIEDTAGMNPGSMIYIFTAKYAGKKTDAIKNDYETVEWFPCQPLPDTVWPNLHFLIPMAALKLQGHDSKSVCITY